MKKTVILSLLVCSFQFAGAQPGGVDDIPAIAVKSLIDLRNSSELEVANTRTRSSGKKKTLQLLGYYAPNDGGGGQFYWDDTATVADNGGTIIKPASIRGAGRWKRAYDGININVKWFGAGQLQSAATNQVAFQRAINSAIQNNYGSGLNSKGVIYVPKGDTTQFYALQDSLLITGDVTITGDDVGGYPYFPCRIWFPQNKSGIVIKGPPLGGANYVTIKNLMIYCQGISTDTIKHGIWSNTRMYMENVKVEGFGGDGIHITTNRGGNANYSQFTRCIAQSNWQNGWHIVGEDANVITLISCSGETNRLSNFLDESWFGNTYIGIHSSDASYMVGNKSRVAHRGTGWIAKQNNVGIEPGVHKDFAYYWDSIGPSKPGPIYVAWNRSDLYRQSSAFISKGEVARTTVIGSYTEQYQGGVHLGQKSLWIGGDMGTGPAYSHTPIAIVDGYQWKFRGLGTYQFPKYSTGGYMGFESEFGLHIGQEGAGVNMQHIQGENLAALYRWHIPSQRFFEFPYANFDKSKFGWRASDGDPIRPITYSLAFRDINNGNKIRSMFFSAGNPSPGAFGVGDIAFRNTADTNIIAVRVIDTKQGSETWRPLYTGNNRLTGIVKRGNSVYQQIGDVETLAFNMGGPDAEAISSVDLRSGHYTIASDGIHTITSARSNRINFPDPSLAAWTGRSITIVNTDASNNAALNSRWAPVNAAGKLLTNLRKGYTYMFKSNGSRWYCISAYDGEEL